MVWFCKGVIVRAFTLFSGARLAAPELSPPTFARSPRFCYCTARPQSARAWPGLVQRAAVVWRRSASIDYRGRDVTLQHPTLMLDAGDAGAAVERCSRRSHPHTLNVAPGRFTHTCAHPPLLLLLLLLDDSGILRRPTTTHPRSRLRAASTTCTTA